MGLLKDDFMTVTKILDEVIKDICDKYCKFPEKYGAKYPDKEEAGEKMMCEQCDKCPLNRL